MDTSTGLFAVALWSLAAVGAHAAPPCPSGDGPGGLSNLEIASVVTHVDVVGGAAAVRQEVVLQNRSDGPAAVSFTLTTAPDGDRRAPPLVLQRARVVGGERATLDSAALASERYDAFVDALQDGVDPELARGGRRRVALHVREVGEGDLLVEVAAACSARTVTIELVGAVLAEPIDDGERLVVPAIADRDALLVSAGDAMVWVDGRRLRQGRVQRARARADDAPAPDAAPPFVIDVSREGGGIRLAGALSRVAAAPIADDDLDASAPSALRAPGFAVLGATLGVPRPMSSAPGGLKLVFVVDASVSAGDDGVARSLQLLEAILDAAPPDAGWALVAMRRRAELVVDPWQPRDRRFVPLVPVENGSDAADALAMAVKIARDAEAGAGRVILLSDLQQRAGDDGVLARALAAVDGPVVHVVRLPPDMVPSEPLDFVRVLAGSDTLATAAARAHGMLLDVASADDSRSDRDLATHLIRPTRLDAPRLLIDGRDQGPLDEDHRLEVLGFGPRADDGDETLPAWLGEGGGIRLAATLPATTSRVQVRGLVWAEEVTLDLSSLPGAVGAVAVATATNADLRDAFETAPDALEAIARSLSYVSAATSLVAVPSFRPARPEGFGMRGSGCCGCGGCHMSGIGRGYSGCSVGVGRTFKAREILDALARDIASRCRAPVDATIEVGDLEIVHVTATGPGRSCVATQLWATRLDQLTPGDGSFEAVGTFALNAPFDDATIDDAP